MVTMSGEEDLRSGGEEVEKRGRRVSLPSFLQPLSKKTSEQAKKKRRAGPQIASHALVLNRLVKAAAPALPPPLWIT
jgi:hypothetical protein